MYPQPEHTVTIRPLLAGFRIKECYVHESSLEFYPSNSPVRYGRRLTKRVFDTQGSDYFVSVALRRHCCYRLEQDRGRSVANRLDQYIWWTVLPLAASICNTNMVNADTAPALPWGASNEHNNVQKANARHSRLSHGLTTAESEPDHVGTPQVEEDWPTRGSTIEVNLSRYRICGMCTSHTLFS